MLYINTFIYFLLLDLSPVYVILNIYFLYSINYIIIIIYIYIYIYYNKKTLKNVNKIENKIKIKLNVFF